jgi:hypothetical protein
LVGSNGFRCLAPKQESQGFKKTESQSRLQYEFEEAQKRAEAAARAENAVKSTTEISPPPPPAVSVTDMARKFVVAEKPGPSASAVPPQKVSKAVQAPAPPPPPPQPPATLPKANVTKRPAPAKPVQVPQPLDCVKVNVRILLSSIFCDNFGPRFSVHPYSLLFGWS